jgi:DNA-binding response OmpR family regulator
MYNILLVDDEQKILDVVGMFLSRQGYMVIGADSGTRALAILAAGRSVDLVVTDVRMADVDGLTLIRTLREQGRATPVIILTGTPDMDKYNDALAALQFSDRDVLNKPVDLFSLLARIREKLGEDGSAAGGRMV